MWVTILFLLLPSIHWHEPDTTQAFLIPGCQGSLPNKIKELQPIPQPKTFIGVTTLGNFFFTLLPRVVPGLSDRQAASGAALQILSWQ